MYKKNNKHVWLLQMCFSTAFRLSGPLCQWVELERDPALVFGKNFKTTSHLSDLSDSHS